MKKHFFQKGNSLIEVLLVILFITVGIVTILSTLNTLNTTSNDATQRKDAIILAKEKLDELKNYTVISSTPGYFAYDDITTGADAPAVGNTTFIRSWNVTTNTDPDYKTVNITVSWTDNTGDAKSVTISTFIGKINPNYLKEVF